MAEMKHTRTYNKLKTSENILEMVRDWGQPKGIAVEDASIVKVIGTKAQIDELEALLKPHLEPAEKAKPPAG